MYVSSRVNLNNLPFSLKTSEIYYTNDRFSFSNRNCFRITLLKIQKILRLTLSLSPFFLGIYSSCSPILTYKVIALSIAIPLFHMFYLAFAASKNLFITRANFEDHIIKFGRLYFVKRKCQPLNIKM